MLQKHIISILNEGGNWYFFAAQTTYDFPKHFVCQSVVYILFLSKFFPEHFYLDCLTIVAVILRAAEYRNRSCLDNLFVNQALNAVFFALIASLTFWFYQAVFSHYLFDLPHVCSRNYQLHI